MTEQRRSKASRRGRPRRGESSLRLRLAETEEDLRASQRLRYKVFAEELGAGGDTVDHVAKIESDQFDSRCEHLLLVDENRGSSADDHVVGSYRLMRSQMAKECGFYSDHEYDLSVLVETGRSLVELGRTCVHPDYRGGAAMLLLWNGLADYVLRNDIEILFGVASFHGTDIESLAQPLTYLHQYHLAPEDLRVRVRSEHFERLDRIAPDQVETRLAEQQIPPLIKAYIRLGGFVGDGAYIDHSFNTVDVCLMIDTENMSKRHFSYYVRNQGKQK